MGCVGGWRRERRTHFFGGVGYFHGIGGGEEGEEEGEEEEEASSSPCWAAGWVWVGGWVGDWGGGMGEGNVDVAYLVRSMGGGQGEWVLSLSWVGVRVGGWVGCRGEVSREYVRRPRGAVGEGIGGTHKGQGAIAGLLGWGREEA